MIHQIPPKPNYLRVKVSRKLSRLGAVPVKNTVYALPKSDSAQEHLEWLLREIVEGGGDGSICEARFVEGLSDQQLEGLFLKAREADYGEVGDELRALVKELPRSGRIDDDRRASAESELARLRRRLDEIAEIDFFGASGREAAQALVKTLEQRLAGSAIVAPAAGTSHVNRAEYVGRVWVTRKGIHVDRMASAWLVRRFIDPEARLKFVVGRAYAPEPGELRFDMFDGEFSHEGDLCTFEVLVKRMKLEEPGLRPIAEIVHDIDLKDGKFARPETAGIERMVAAIAFAHREDEERLARASAVLDDLYQLYRQKRS